MSDCLNCGHPRESHCHCGSSRLHKMGPGSFPGSFRTCGICLRFCDENGLAPCRVCESNASLKKVTWMDGTNERATYRCTACFPNESSRSEADV